MNPTRAYCKLLPPSDEGEVAYKVKNGPDNIEEMLMKHDAIVRSWYVKDHKIHFSKFII